MLLGFKIIYPVIFGPIITRNLKFKLILRLRLPHADVTRQAQYFPQPINRVFSFPRGEGTTVEEVEFCAKYAEISKFVQLC